MNQTYPPSCNKPSKAPSKYGNCNPTRNKRTHPFVLHSSSHSLCVGHRCRQTLHSLVLFCLPFHTPLSIGVWLWLYCFLLVCGHTLYGFVFGYLCVVFVFFMTLVYMWVYFGCGYNFGCFSSCLCCISTIYICEFILGVVIILGVSLLAYVVFRPYICEFILHVSFKLA